jgi:ABC-2 type transport system ATP-binding protein
MIAIDHLTKRYGSFTAVDGISLEVREGEIYGFLGPNGAGKTTTIRILAGLSLPTSGSVRVAGRDIRTDSLSIKALTGYIPDRPYLYEKLTADELLQFVANLYGREWADCSAKAGEMLQYFDLQDWRNTRIENFSHGMKQKLVIVSALIHDPLLLIIDEPMVGLDALAQRQVKQLLRRLAAGGKSIFLTTHTLSVAEAVCDRMAIIHHGKIIASGSVESLKEDAGRPGTPLEDVFLQLTYDDDVRQLD